MGLRLRAAASVGKSQCLNMGFYYFATIATAVTTTTTTTTTTSSDEHLIQILQLGLHTHQNKTFMMTTSSEFCRQANTSISQDITSSVLHEFSGFF